MGENSGIEWTDHTFNEWEGCTKVSVGDQGACELCYAEARNVRFAAGANWGPGAPRRLTSLANRQRPYFWDRAALVAGERPWVFCMSLADVFDNEVPDAWRRSLWGRIVGTKHLRWQLLTKRIGNAAKMLPSPDDVRNLMQHVGVMATIANQVEAERDIPKLVKLKASHGVRWVGLSCEPLLGKVDLTEWLWNFVPCRDCPCPEGGPLKTAAQRERYDRCCKDPELGGPLIDWVIAGGEHDPQRKGRARPSHPDWFRSLRDQCAAAGVPFFFKQHGDWIVPFDGDPACAVCGCTENWACDGGCHWVPLGGMNDLCSACVGKPVPAERAVRFQLQGKKHTGRILDGRTHDEMPKVFDLETTP